MNFLHFLLTLLAHTSHSQVTSKISRTIPGASISYRKTTACNASLNTPSYTGYIHLNSTVIPNFPHNISTFFWFFPARKPAGANLALYLAGGPGQASSFAALTENGPCTAQADGKSVVENRYSFNENAHVLYVDQPSQVGFSYDGIVDGVFDALGGVDGGGTGVVVKGVGEEGVTRIRGRFPSQKPGATARTSSEAAKHMWFFLQVFMADFGVPYGEKNSVSIWGNSYGGMYTAALAAYLLRANIKPPAKPGTPYAHLSVPSIGITNGCLDLPTQVLSYATLPFNNTYDTSSGSPFHIYNSSLSSNLVATANRTGGCLNLVSQCRKVKDVYDVSDEGLDPRVREACSAAILKCNTEVLLPYFHASITRSQYDMALPQAQPWPPKAAASYLNQERVRALLGVPKGLNYSLFSAVVNSNFIGSGDPVRDGRRDLLYILERSTRVAMVYGDRDWRCNWVGGENLALSLGWPVDKKARKLAESGYVEVRKPSSGEVAAVTRQNTLVSFTRVFQAGHAVSWYAPETVQTIFTRTMRDLDVATGQKRGSSTVTKGRSSSWVWRLKLPSLKPPNGCSLWNFGDSCSVAQERALRDGSAIVDEAWNVRVPGM